MVTTSVSDAIVFPQSTGTGLGNNTDQLDALLMSALARYQGGEYVETSIQSGLAFQNHNGSNNTVDVGPGICYIKDDSTSTSNNRDGSGNPQGESSDSSGFDYSLSDHHYMVVLPTATTISVSDSTLNEVYVDISDVTSNNEVNLEHDGSNSASPANTSLKLGETNPDDSSADTRANDDPSLTASSVSADKVNSIIFQGPSESVSAAINRAKSGDMILLQSGTFSENIEINTGDLTIMGRGRGTIIDGDDDNAIKVNSVKNVIIKNLSVKTTAGQGNKADGIQYTSAAGKGEVTSIYALESDRHGVGIDGAECRVVSVHCDSGNIDGNGVNFFGNSNNCIADDIIGTVSDSGSNNTVGDIA